MPKITKDTIIAEALRTDGGTVRIFMEHGLHCLGCAGATMESIGDAARVHGIDADKLVDDLNDYFVKRGYSEE